MSIEVLYNNFSLKETAIAQYSDILERFSRDISWGTYIEDLKAVESMCEDLRNYEPIIISKHLATEQRYFKLSFKDNVFNILSEGIDHFIGTIAGDVIQYSDLESIEVANFDFLSEQYKDIFRGPNIGINNLYEVILKDTLKGIKRPILAFSVKPRMGQSVEEYKKIYISAAKGGIDIIEDDERLIDPVYCPFKDRIDAMKKVQGMFNTKFSANITGPVDKMIQRLNYAYQMGIRIVKVDVMVTGFDALKTVSDYIRESLKNEVAITCYPDATGMYRKLSRTFILKMARLCGADIIYTSTPRWARMDDEFRNYGLNIQGIAKKLEYHKLLENPIHNFDNLKTTLPTISNGCNISEAELIQFIYRKEFNGHYQFAFFVGGGISGFPANIEQTINEWISCLEFTATKEINNYNNYNYKFRKQMEKNNMMIYNLKEEIKS